MQINKGRKHAWEMHISFFFECKRKPLLLTSLLVIGAILESFSYSSRAGAFGLQPKGPTTYCNWKPPKGWSIWFYAILTFTLSLGRLLFVLKSDNRNNYMFHEETMRSDILGYSSQSGYFKLTKREATYPTWAQVIRWICMSLVTSTRCTIEGNRKV